MSSIYTAAPSVAKPVTYAQRDALRELRRRLMRLWLYNRPGSRRRELIRELVKQVDELLSHREAAR